ncbi:MAG: 50S ribosomal protein L25/general stress protein Ctc [Gemmatimonadetes bacterium]|nr:50S ribosomal protein L25/general stress protein Ctc [Gemmatimonadota bacterium]
MATEARITAATRDETGKGAARSLRREGKVPGVVYGHGEDSVPVTVEVGELMRLTQSVSVENTIVDLSVEDLDGGESYKVLVREIQRHPFKREFVHVDFFRVAMDEKIHVDVPVTLIGIPTGVKDRGGVLEHMLRELEVYCLPGSIPEKVEIDVSHLDIGDSIHVGEIELPDVEVLTDADRSIVAVLAPTVIEEPEEEEELPEDEFAEPELIGREREAEEEGVEPAEEKGGEEKEE